MSSSTYDEFMDNYAKDGASGRIALVLDMGEWDNEFSPFIIVRHKGHVMVINPMAFEDHLCVDVHPFEDGKDASVAAFGMSSDRPGRATFGDTGRTSHGWASSKMVSLLLGKQA